MTIEIKNPQLKDMKNLTQFLQTKMGFVKHDDESDAVVIERYNSNTVITKNEAEKLKIETHIKENQFVKLTVLVLVILPFHMYLRMNQLDFHFLVDIAYYAIAFFIADIPTILRQKSHEEEFLQFETTVAMAIQENNSTVE